MAPATSSKLQWRNVWGTEWNGFYVVGGGNLVLHYSDILAYWCRPAPLNDFLVEIGLTLSTSLLDFRIRPPHPRNSRSVRMNSQNNQIAVKVLSTIIFLLFACSFAATACAQDQDVVYLKNGSIIRGTIKVFVRGINPISAAPCLPS